MQQPETYHRVKGLNPAVTEQMAVWLHYKEDINEGGSLEVQNENKWEQMDNM